MDIIAEPLDGLFQAIFLLPLPALLRLAAPLKTRPPVKMEPHEVWRETRTSAHEAPVPDTPKRNLKRELWILS